MVAHPNVTFLLEAINLFDASTVAAKVGCGIEIDAEGMPFLTRRNIVKDVGNGAREHLGAIQQKRCQEGDAKLACGMCEGINS